MPTVIASMLLLCMLIIWKIQAVPQNQLNMYNNNNQEDEYCLILYTVDGPYDSNDPMHMRIRIHQTTSYCLRTSEEVNLIGDWNFRNTIESSFTFDELKEKRITSQMLLSWSASIDLAEQYQIFLHSDSNLLSEKEVVFHNCTSLWFGPSCRFAFDYEIDKPFYEIVDTVFQFKFEVDYDTKVTCYEHFHCDTVLSCLDWREICDGKSDCLDGSDENNCWQLEVNECDNNEYRCHNGQCIPFEFFHDNSKHPDCLDGTDEPLHSVNTGDCYKTPNFNCEEHMCRPGNEEYSCGDGQCTNGINRCHNGRKILLANDFCSNATACYMNSYSLVDFERCTNFCLNSSCVKDNRRTRYEIRYMLLLFGHVRFIFSNDLTPGILTLPDYVCYDETLCADFLPAAEPIDNLTCSHFDDLVLINTDSYANNDTFFKKIKDRFRTCLITSNETFYCHYSTMYQCQNSSKCISKQRLLDGIHDCPYEDDETFNQSCSLNDVHHRFNCSVDGIEKCFASLVLEDRKEDCTNNDDEWNQEQKLAAKHIYFQTICDGKQDLLPRLIDGQNETDETDCEHWPCNNTYSRCDGFWLCKNGSDEVNCSPSTCLEFHHDCVFPNYTSNLSCLPIAHAGDGKVDCLGATDEREGYYESSYGTVEYYFRCWNHTEYIKVDRKQLCNNKSDCESNEDEIFCTSFASQEDSSYCKLSSDTTDAEQFLRNLVCPPIKRPPIKYFKLGNMLTFPFLPTIDSASTTGPVIPPNESNPVIVSPLDTEMILMNVSSNEQFPTSEHKYAKAWWCNRGVPIRIRMDGNTSELHCLCPQSYYGDKCQYQNQRVSLTLRIRMTSEWRTIFILLITLIDNERNIQSYNHIQYLPFRHCADKFNIYLLYSTRPKNSSRNYSVQIDVFNYSTFNYRASWIFPLPFSFLPVHRLPVSLIAPFSNVEPVQQCSPSCTHGQCFHYINDPNSTFCRCPSGWSGAQCDIEHQCACAPGSLCISNSTCLCPLGRFGPRCYLLKDSCRPDSCMYGGKCVPMDVRHEAADLEKFVCICLEGYEGDRCERKQKQTKIDISFHHKLSIPPSLLIHFIAVQDKQTIRTTVMKKIAFDQRSLTLSTSISFNIAFAQIFRRYYLIILQEEIVTSPDVPIKVIPSHQCRSITELFNDTFTNQDLLKRIKYYHIPCKQHPELVCFFDKIHLCLCTLDRTANCFEFNHSATYDCGGHNYCENGGYCFQDNRTCPKSSSCACPKCYFGSKCQFSTKGFSLSLDTILGYHIHKEPAISQQPAIVKVAIALTTIMFISGFINSILSFRTFQEEETRTVGCGLYLFASSIMSMIIVIVLILKFSFLVASHMGSINNGLFLRIQCISTDFLLRLLISSNDWLNAFVSIEQTINVLKGIKFDKEKSKLVAKWMIFIIVISTSCTLIYDPIHRRLIDDAEEECTWCITQYSSSVHKYDSFINVFHFSVPFAINCISALIVIITAARIRSNSQKAKPFKEYLHDQLKYHKQLLISPSILITLALPQLVISFLSGCMESVRDSWFYLFGYFISFIPSITTFVVFILPSETYMKAFNESIRRIWYR